MKRLNFVKVLLIASALCVLPASGQGGNLMGCVTKLICDVAPYIEQCCSESFVNDTLGKEEMINCLYGVFIREAQGCMGGQNPEAEGEVQRFRTRRINQRVPFASKETYRRLGRYRKYSPISRKPFRSGSVFGNYGGSDIMQNEACQIAKSNGPNTTEDCPAWSEAANNCIKEIPLIKFICQGGNSIFTIGQNPFGGMGGGGNFGGIGGGGSFGGMGGLGNFGGMGGGGSFGGIGGGGSFGGMGGLGNFGGMGGGGSFGGMGGSDFGFGGSNPFGGGTGFNRFSTPGYVGVVGKPEFGKPGKRKVYTPNPDDEREYEAIPVSDRRSHIGFK